MCLALRVEVKRGGGGDQEKIHFLSPVLHGSLFPHVVLGWSCQFFSRGHILKKQVDITKV